MPKELINDEVSQGWYTEVSWRRKPCAHAPDETGPVCDDVAERGSASGHVQLATVNALSPFHFPDIETGDHFEAGEKFDGWRVTLDEAGIDRLIKTLHKAKRQAFGRYAAGGFVASNSTSLDPDEHVLRDVTTHADHERMWICARGDHDGQLCQERPYTWAEIIAVPQPIPVPIRTPEQTGQSGQAAF